MIYGNKIKGCEEKSRQLDMLQRVWMDENRYRRSC